MLAPQTSKIVGFPIKSYPCKEAYFFFRPGIAAAGLGNTSGEVIGMSSYVSPKLRPRFETLSVDLKNEILSRGVHLETLQDLIAVLEQIVQEGEAAP